MSQEIMSMKALLLSKEEAMAMLDLCLNCSVDMDKAQERIMMKVTDLVRRYIAEEEAAGAYRASAPSASGSPAVMPPMLSSAAPAMDADTVVASDLSGYEYLPAALHLETYNANAIGEMQSTEPVDTQPDSGMFGNRILVYEKHLRGAAARSRQPLTLQARGTRPHVY